MDVNTLHEDNIREVLKHELAPDAMRQIRGLLNALYYIKLHGGLNHSREELQKMTVRWQKFGQYHSPLILTLTGIAGPRDCEMAAR